MLDEDGLELQIQRFDENCNECDIVEAHAGAIADLLKRIQFLRKELREHTHVDNVRKQARKESMGDGYTTI